MADAGDKRIVVFVNTRSPQPWVGSHEPGHRQRRHALQECTRYRLVRAQCQPQRPVRWRRHAPVDYRRDRVPQLDPRRSQEGTCPCIPRTTSTIRSRQPSSPPPTRSSMRSFSSRTSWAPTSNLQRKLPPPAVRDVPYVTAPRDTPDTAEERPPCDRILDASPPRALFPSPHPQQTTQNHSFRAGSKRSWDTKEANMSTVTILIAGKTTQNGAHAVARDPSS